MILIQKNKNLKVIMIKNIKKYNFFKKFCKACNKKLKKKLILFEIISEPT